MLRIWIIFFSIILLCAGSCTTTPKHEVQIPTDFCSKINSTVKSNLGAELADYSELMKNQTGIFVLEEGSGSMMTRAWLCEKSEQTIDIQYFIFSTDNVGLIACDYLVKAADRGVKIRIIVDDIMVDADLEDVLMMDSHENISIKIYNPGVNLGKGLFGKAKEFATNFRSANQRMHNKTFIVDGKVVITGGRNIADEYFDYDHEYNFRDRDVLLLGKVSEDVNSSFNQFWTNDLCVPILELAEDGFAYDTNSNRFDKLHEYACDSQNYWPQVRTQVENLSDVFETLKRSNRISWVENVKFVSDIPGKNDGTEGLGGGGVTTSSLIELIKKAKKSIEIQTPYLITTELGKGLFKEAVDRGVKIRILTNSLASTDNTEAFSSYQSDREELLKTGMHIYEFRPDAAERSRVMAGELHTTLDHQPIFGLHAKSMVIDGEITVIGTFNLDPRSANLNTECFVIIPSSKVASEVLLGMEEEFKPENSWKITLDFNPDSEVSTNKRIKTWTRKVLPKAIL